MDLIRRLKFSHRLTLILVLFCAGFAGYGLWTFETIETVRVGGPISQRVEDSQNLVADILPPPLYIVESYLVCLQITAATNGLRQGALIDRLKQLQVEYLERHAHWSRVVLDHDISTLLLEDSHRQALAFYDVAFEGFLPALFLNDRETMQARLLQMTRIYEAHRDIVDRVVVLAKASAKKEETVAIGRIDHAKVLLFAILLILMVLGIAVARTIQRSIIAPVERAVAIAGQIASGAYTILPEPKYFPDEGGMLLRALEQMAASLQTTVATLATRNDELRRAMDQLVESEKLAAMGGMVAGVSHELNTPLGNAMTVADSLQARARALNVAFTQGLLKKSDATQQLNDLQDMATLIFNATQRAAHLVTSFKQVAVDQVSQRRRAFDLQEVVDEHLDALQPGLKRQDVTIDNRIPAGMLLDSYPGALGQVVTNLVQNAVVHAFDDRQSGTVHIDAELSGRMLEIRVTDNGVGISAAMRPRVFEPFFTTRLGQGGSGLGLAICHRIVTQVLGGSIEIQSVGAPGAQFIIRIPLVAPGRM